MRNNETNLVGTEFQVIIRIILIIILSITTIITFIFILRT